VVQAADQLREVNESVLGPIVGLAMTKELGPVMMAFLLAGRAGSAMAAELGSMTVYDEINALRTMDIDPVRFLVMPRFVAATLALPLLILYSDFIGVWGGAVVVAIDPAIKLTVNEYFARMLEWVHLSDILIGLVKGLIFGMISSILPCTFGLRTRGGTEGIATATTAAVVWSFILIIVFDFLIVRGSFAAGSWARGRERRRSGASPWSSRACAGRTTASTCCAASISPCGPASCSPSSARAARGNPCCSARSSGSSVPTRAAS